MFGKLLFVVADLLIGVLLNKILAIRFPSLDQKQRGILVAVWLLNPIAINVSTRGNAESLIGFLVLLTLYLILKKQLVLGSIMFTQFFETILNPFFSFSFVGRYGFAVHFKIYPIIYSIAMLLFIGDYYKSTKIPLPILSLTFKQILFGLISGFTFLGVTLGMYYL